MHTIPLLAKTLVAMGAYLMLLVPVTLSPVSVSAAAPLADSSRYSAVMCLCHRGSIYDRIVFIRATVPPWAIAEVFNSDQYLRFSPNLRVALMDG